MKNKRITPAEKEQIVQLSSEGKGMEEIAEMFSLSIQAVYSVIRESKDQPKDGFFNMDECCWITGFSVPKWADYL
jgi:transposase-like protein